MADKRGKWTNAAKVLLGVMEWDCVEKGPCSSCRKVTDKRSRYTPYAAAPAKTSRAPVGSPEHEMQVDRWMAQTQEQQKHGQFTRSWPQLVCLSCAMRHVNVFTDTQAGTLTGMVMTLVTPVRDGWTALVWLVRPGVGEAHLPGAVNGTGRFNATEFITALHQVGDDGLPSFMPIRLRTEGYHEAMGIPAQDDPDED